MNFAFRQGAARAAILSTRQRSDRGQHGCAIQVGKDEGQGMGQRQLVLPADDPLVNRLSLARRQS